MSTTPKPPAQLRLTFTDEYHGVDQPRQRLGFAQPYEPAKSGWESKQLTQDTWAYGEKWNKAKRYGYHEDGRVYMIRWKVEEGRGVYAQDAKGGFIQEIQEVPDHLQPCIIDNVPMEGFKIARSVSRYSTSNKLWRIDDPRGFQLEISTSNLEDLIMETTIKQGHILAPCIWGHGKAKLQLA